MPKLPIRRRIHKGIFQEGKTLAELMKELNISPRLIEFHLSKLASKDPYIREKLAKNLLGEQELKKIMQPPKQEIKKWQKKLGISEKLVLANFKYLEMYFSDAKLSEQNWHALGLILEGKTIKEIGSELGGTQAAPVWHIVKLEKFDQNIRNRILYIERKELDEIALRGKISRVLVNAKAQRTTITRKQLAKAVGITVKELGEQLKIMKPTKQKMKYLID